ncbi:MAG: hypothetical protein LUG51_07415 [Tannerellaceae bacterium]|nr:hypothetical protein [Tannerellaceae bacterium]
MDQIIGIESDKRKPFTLQVNDFEFPTEIDFVMWENYVNILDLLKSDPSLTLFETWNSLPYVFCYKYSYLTRFYIFKWVFQSKNHTPIKRFSQIQIPPRLKHLSEESMKKYALIPNSQYIFEERIFANLINDLKFFINIRLIEVEELEMIQSELEQLIREMEDLATRGKHKETGNDISLYISGVSIDTNYSCLEANGYYISLVRTLILNAAATTDKSSFDYIKQWFTSLKRISTLISVSGEKQRISFFNKQREIIRSL